MITSGMPGQRTCALNASCSMLKHSWQQTLAFRLDNHPLASLLQKKWVFVNSPRDRRKQAEKSHQATLWCPLQLCIGICTRQNCHHLPPSDGNVACILLIGRLSSQALMEREKKTQYLFFLSMEVVNICVLGGHVDIEGIILFFFPVLFFLSFF